MAHQVYLLKCATPNHWYIGYTANFERRFREHIRGHVSQSSKQGASFTRRHGIESGQPIATFKELETASIAEDILIAGFKLFFERIQVDYVIGGS